MPAYKDNKTGTWYVQFRYKDWKGERVQKMKRGFRTKHDALDWEREFLSQKQSDINMTFESFCQLYEQDIKPRLKLNTWKTKESIINAKILPFFAKRKLAEISPKDVIDWQNEVRKMTDSNGKVLSPGYLKTIHNQLSAIFNHAVRFYNLNANPAQKAGNMGKEGIVEMKFWTPDEYDRFSEAMMDKDISYHAFQMLYWCGIREGELLALTPADFDFDKKTVSITKSYQRIGRQDIITIPKTPKSVRVIQLPDFLSEEMKDYISRLYSVEPDTRIFPVTKSYLYHEMKRGCQETGVKKIRVHDLRHSHVSLLIELGFIPKAVADRMGHEAIDITYRYAHLFPTEQSRMADKLNKANENLHKEVNSDDYDKEDQDVTEEHGQP